MSVDGGTDTRPGREVAFRIFAAEFDDASLSHAESDEERAPNYVIAPTGARLNRIFAVGTLTEVSDVNEEMVRARIVDPTGAFVVYAGQYQPEALAFLERAEPPAFVSVTGKARTFEPDDGDRVYTSIRPETLAEVDGDTRDRWVVDAAEHTIDRIGTYAAAAELDATGDHLASALRANGVPEGLSRGIPLAQEHYGTTPAYLAALRETALDAVRVVAGERSQVDPLEFTPGDADPEGPDFATLAADGPTLSLPDGVATGESESGAAAEGEPELTTTDPASGAAVGTAEASPQSEPADDTAVGDANAALADDDGDGEAKSDRADEPQPDDELGDFDAADAASTSDGTDAEESEPAPESTSDADDAEDSTDDELGDFESDGLDDEPYEIDEEEREQIEAEYGTEFTTGADVDEPGEADIDVPDPADSEGSTDDSEGATDDERDADETADDGAEGTEAGGESESGGMGEDVEADAEVDGDDEVEVEAVDDDDVGDDDAEPEAVDDVDVQSLAVETMDELDDGDGADRDAVVEAVVEETGASAETVEEAIQDALMGGECYEPADGTLKAI